MASAGEPATNSGTDADGGASVTEGLATVYFPSEKGVFYNPPQIPNRDLSVLALRHFAQQWQREAAEKAEKQAAKAARWAAKQAAMAAEDGKKGAEADESAATPAAAEAPTRGEPARIRVLDALTASGLRALRYVKEVPEVASVVANDLSPEQKKFVMDALASTSGNIDRFMTLMPQEKVLAAKAQIEEENQLNKKEYEEFNDEEIVNMPAKKM